MRIFLAAGDAWKRIVAFCETLAPARVSVLIAAAVPCLFIWVGQGFDILCALGEPADSPMFRAHVVWFFVALTFLGLTNWYGPRFLLNCNFGGAARNEHLRRALAAEQLKLKRFEHRESWLKSHVPRFLGAAPAAVFALGFVRAARVNSVAAEKGQAFLLLAALSGALAVLMYAGFVARRKLINSLQSRRNAVAPAYENWRDIAADRWALRGLALFTLPAVALGAVFTFDPIPAGMRIGAGAVLLFALASWAWFGAIAIYWGHRVRLPTLSIAALVAVAASFWNDNHEVRTLPANSPEAAREPLGAAYDQWHESVSHAYPSEPKHPMFIVVTEGGGIRAGYWTALVLAKLQSGAGARFSDHLFAISGVSGGSLGAATFTALLAEANPEAMVSRTRSVLEKDFLAPLAGKMFFPDLWQRFIPYPFEALDRGRALEDGWSFGFPPFGRDFAELFPTDKRRLPALFFNGTEAESGRRIITSTVEFAGGRGVAFVDAIDGLAKMEGNPIRLSTAVHASARFTYFSPAGRYPDGTHVVDGGYFENSGGNTAHDILKVVMTHPHHDVMPVLLIITNGPEKPPPADSEKADAERALRGQHVSHELLVPVVTMLNTRTAHANLSLGELKDAGPELQSITFGLVQRGTVLPLGWTLSKGAIAEMEYQVDPGPNGAGDLLNSKNIASVLGLLGVEGPERIAKTGRN